MIVLDYKTIHHTPLEIIGNFLLKSKHLKMESPKKLEVTSQKRQHGEVKKIRLVDLIRLPGESEEETMNRFHSRRKTAQVKRNKITKKKTTQVDEVHKTNNHASSMSESKFDTDSLIDGSGITLDEEVKQEVKQEVKGKLFSIEDEAMKRGTIGTVQDQSATKKRKRKGTFISEDEFKQLIHQ